MFLRSGLFHNMFRPSKSARFRCFVFLVYFTTCFGQTGHHQVYKVCLRCLLCFPLDVFDASRCLIQVMLRHAFMSSHVLGLSVMCTSLHYCLYMVGIILNFWFSIIEFVLLVTFVEYVAFIFSSVVSALLGSACSPCVLPLIT
jgi:hypothetical protein